MDQSEIEWHRSYRTDVHARLADAVVVPFREFTFNDNA